MVKSLGMAVLFSIILATSFISLLSLVGLLFIAVGIDVRRIILHLLSLAVGALLGGAFFHLLPGVAGLETRAIFLFVVLGIMLFFSLEKFLYWRHCHKKECRFHMFTYLNLIGDATHNFVDGLILAGAFTTAPSLGFSTLLAVVFHEIPQEIGDFGILIHGGFSQKRALAFNLFSALFSVLGGVVGYFFFSTFQGFTLFLMPITAGGFVYIALSDLVPSLHGINGARETIAQLGLIGSGLFIMWLLP